MNNLAIVYAMQGKNAQAEPLYSQTLEIDRRVLGPEHPETLIAMSNLANIYTSEGKYAQAEALYRQTGDQAPRTGGRASRHPTAMNNVATAYERQGKYAQAEALYRQPWRSPAGVLGPEHPDKLPI